VNGGDRLYTVAIFDAMVLKDAPLSGGDYVDDTSTEQIYLAGGMARVFDDVAPGGVAGTMPQASTSTTNAASVHTFLSFGDSRASGAFVVDKDSGELVERATYLAYGALESDLHPQRWESSREDLKLAGQWDNAEVGLDYFGARYYSPQLGRFISPDPLTIHALEGDANPYEYAYGSPLRYIDPTGLGPECDPESGGCSSDPGPGDDDNNDPVVVSGSSGGGTGTSGSGGGGGGENMGGGGPTAGDRRVQAEFQSFRAEAAVQPFALTPPTFENVGRAAYSGLRQGLSQAALLGTGAFNTYNWAQDVWAATDPNASAGSALFHGGLRSVPSCRSWTRESSGSISFERVRSGLSWGAAGRLGL
jgi:RHS repeat-associated protein